MTVQKIIDVIFDNGLEIEVYKELTLQLISIYGIVKNNNNHLRNINRAVYKIATENPDAKNAIEGIKALLEE